MKRKAMLSLRRLIGGIRQGPEVTRRRIHIRPCRRHAALRSKIIVDEQTRGILRLLNFTSRREIGHEQDQVDSYLGGLGIGTYLLMSAIDTVSEVEQAIITQFGRPVGAPVTDAGLKFKFPSSRTST